MLTSFWDDVLPFAIALGFSGALTYWLVTSKKTEAAKLNALVTGCTLFFFIFGIFEAHRAATVTAEQQEHAYSPLVYFSLDEDGTLHIKNFGNGPAINLIVIMSSNVATNRAFQRTAMAAGESFPIKNFVPTRGSIQYGGAGGGYYCYFFQGDGHAYASVPISYDKQTTCALEKWPFTSEGTLR